jgi:hypothetical protein
MNLLFWRGHEALDAFSTTLAEAFAKRVPPSALAGSPARKKAAKLERSFDGALRALLGEVSRYKRENRLNVYTKARMLRGFRTRMEALGYEADLIEEITRMMLLQS